MTDSTTLKSAEIGSGALDEGSASSEGSALPSGKNSSITKKILKALAWFFLGFYCLVFFTLLKLPEDRVRNLIQGYVAYTLSGQGISFSAEKSSLSFAFGIHYTMKDVTLNFPSGQDPVKISEISVSPSLLSLLILNLGAGIHLENKGGTLDAFYKQPFKSADGKFSFSFSTKNLDLGSLGILPIAAGIKGSAVISGDGKISGSLMTPTTLSGSTDLEVSLLNISQQTLYGFSIPQLAIAQSKINLSIDGGKATVKTFQVGGSGSTSDDIRGNITGDVTLGKVIPYSTLNLKTTFNLSQTILKSFVLLDAILGGGKNADGSYSFAITGNLSSPNFQPAK